MDIECTKDILRQIAKALGVSEDAFLAQGKLDYKNKLYAALLEQSEILKLFQSIQDPILRRYCIDFVRDIANKSVSI